MITALHDPSTVEDTHHELADLKTCFLFVEHAGKRRSREERGAGRSREEQGGGGRRGAGIIDTSDKTARLLSSKGLTLTV